MYGRPLEGVRVLDLTTAVVGPACTARLAEYGARVTRIESREGDIMRSLGGPSPGGDHSGTYLHLNQGKRSIGLDLKNAEARSVVDRLLANSEVFVSNLRVDALARLGLDAEAVLRRQPGIVHCTISGFGPQGSYTGRPAYDSVIQGASGVAGLFGRRDRKPAFVPLVLCDHMAGEIAAGAVVAALFKSSREGTGTSLEVPMFEIVSAMVLREHLGAATFVPPLGAPGDTRLLNPATGPIETADGWITLTANTDAQVQAFLRAIGREDLAGDPRFATVAARNRNVDAWLGIRAEALKTKTSREWLAAFAALDVPAMPCHDLDSLIDDPHLNDVGLIGELDHPTQGRMRALRPTVLFDGRVGDRGSPAPALGWDTAEILEEIGFGSREIENLKASGAAIFAPEG